MELASIYLYETKFNENKFTLDFLTNESNFNVFFNEKTTYYITNLDANLILDEESNEIETTTYNDNIKKLSELSNKLIKNSFNNNKRFDFVHLSWFDTEVFKYDLIINDDIIDLMSYKYKFLDVKKKKFLTSKIYDPYLHLKHGVEFKFDKGNSIYKIQLVKNKLIKTLRYQTKDFKIDLWYKYVNFMLVNLTNNKFIFKFPRYELLENLYIKLNKNLSTEDLLKIYYQNIDLQNEIICHESTYSNLSVDDKQKVVIVILNTNRIRILPYRFLFVISKNYRGLFNCFTEKLKYNGNFAIPKNILDAIKAEEPLFPFSSVDSYYTGLRPKVISINSNSIQRIVNNDLNYNLLLYIKSLNSNVAKYFRSSIGIINAPQETILTTEEQNRLKELMSEDVDEIKELIKKEEIIKSLQPVKILKQKHFYLYDNANLIKPTLITELNKNINVY